MLYELVNPSDAYVFQADSFPVAVVAAWMISPMYAVKPEEGEDYFGIPALMEDPFKEYRERFDSVENIINGHREEIVDALRSIALGGFKDYRRYLLAIKVIDDIEKFAEFREKWNDNRSSMNDICKRAENLADWLKKQHYVL